MSESHSTHGAARAGDRVPDLATCPRASLPAGDVWLVRPDAYLGFVGHGDVVRPLVAWLRRWFPVG